MSEGMNYTEFWRFIKLLDDSDLLGHVELIGSWCEYIYAQSGYLPGFTASLRTLDIDFLIKNMRKPTPKVNFAAIASEKGYTIDHDVLTGTTKIYTPDLMEVEFLIEQKGAATEQVIETNIGINAQALHHIGLLKTYAVIIPVFGMNITVPAPEAYAVHKMIINQQRGRKSEKDRQSIERLLPYLNTNKLNEVMSSLTKKERRLADEYICGMNGMD